MASSTAMPHTNCRNAPRSRSLSPHNRIIPSIASESYRSPLRRLFHIDCRHDPDLDLGLDILGEVDLDRIEAKLLQRPGQADLVLRDRKLVALQRVGDVLRADGA